MLQVQVSVKKDLNDIEIEVKKILSENKITMEAHYIGECKMNPEDKQSMDKFVIVFKDSDTNKTESFDFHTGFGHRKTPKKSAWGKTIIFKPTEASVLYCLLNDAQCGSMSFMDFCYELGYNYDSIKDMNMHRKLEQDCKRVYSMFKCHKRLSEALQDY